MSELEKTAPNEIYLIVGDTDKDCNFNELVEVTWADLPIYEETAIKYIKSSQLTIPKSIADELEEEIEEAYSNDYIRSYSDVGAYMEVITDGLDEDSELYKFMFPDDALIGCSHRNIIYLYLVDNDLVKVGEGEFK
ncbi:hypothetical protein [Lactococcus lactis]|uniref:hypothetical protein n=1 Tax=Lactococcus lactis TaxID=1358 RepID=UPI0022E19B9A|nr:hypothetical protein [Lactococcus lactis]